MEVVIPPDIIYEETSGDIMVPEGGNTKLMCKARGYPKPKIEWKREGNTDITLRGTTGAKTKCKRPFFDVDFVYYFSYQDKKCTPPIRKISKHIGQIRFVRLLGGEKVFQPPRHPLREKVRTLITRLAINRCGCTSWWRAFGGSKESNDFHHEIQE